MNKNGKLFEIRIKYDGVSLVDRKLRSMKELHHDIDELDKKMGR